MNEYHFVFVKKKKKKKIDNNYLKKLGQMHFKKSILSIFVCFIID